MSANFIPDEMIALLYQDEIRLVANDKFDAVLSILDEYTETRDLLVGAGIDLLTENPRSLRQDLRLQGQIHLGGALEYVSERTATQILRAIR